MIDTQLFVQLITAAAGSAGFGLLFHIKKRYIGLVGIGGMIGWLVYVFCTGIWDGVFLPSLAAGFIVDVYAEILARICKETSTSFFVTSIIPLVPGSTLFYCMSSIVEGNNHMALIYGRDTFYFALGIAVGMSAAWSICYFGRTVRNRAEESSH
ncbi:MAG: threonine/serine exporter family protein [Clostridia bacterium]|nr:threonine/serine exporter family protein [Clostridia bacterium]